MEVLWPKVSATFLVQSESAETMAFFSLQPWFLLTLLLLLALLVALLLTPSDKQPVVGQLLEKPNSFPVDSIE